MNKKTMSMVKGLGAGMTVGMVAGIAGTIVYNNNKKTIKKKATKAVKAMGNIVEDVQSMIR